MVARWLRNPILPANVSGSLLYVERNRCAEESVERFLYFEVGMLTPKVFAKCADRRERSQSWVHYVNGSSST